MIRIPDNLMQQIIEHCRINGIAMAEIGSNDGTVSMLLFGNGNITPDEASIIAAHMLLTGVLSRGFAEDNQKQAELEKQSIRKENLN